MQKNYFKIGIIVIILAWAVFFQDAKTAASAEKPDFKVIIGEWVRPDGGYIVRVQDVNPDGSVDAGYFNPPEKDALAGFYYQAATGQTYEVVFLRKKEVKPATQT